jgi:DNA processing protein
MYEYWFACIQGMSCAKKRKMREGIKNAKKLYYIEETELKDMCLTPKEMEIFEKSRKNWNVEEEFYKLKEKQVQFVTIFDSGYPKRLLQISSPPYALYYKGKLPSEHEKTAAIVGARMCSPYGETMARKLAVTLVNAGYTIVSGMAKGVDSAGHRGALLVGGESYGILGCGVDVCYPREEIELYMNLQKQGGVISEFPIGTPPLPKQFPARNRIISGLSDVVIVVEAKEKSGSLITADMALEQGKDVFALPGPVNSTLSRGCNRLIHQGAGIILSPEELLCDLGFTEKIMKGDKKPKKILLETTENIVYSCLCLNPLSLEEIRKKTNFSVSQLLDILMGLQLKGFVKEYAKNYYAIVEDI